jgi:hypothetical protein
MLATTSIWSSSAQFYCGRQSSAALVALTSWLLASIQKLARAMPQVDRDAVFVFLGD